MVEGVLAEIIRRKRHDVAARLDGITLDPEPTGRSLRRALERPGARFIMEVKKASPSGHLSTVSVDDAVDAYAGVADAISVLTDEPFFNGSLEDLRIVRAKFDGPILAKDFIVEPIQVGEARLHGADAVLAIMAAVDDSVAASIMVEARRLGMDVIVEVHDEVELQRAIALGAEIIGINNRDLRTLTTDLATTERLAGAVPDECILISESGISTRSDVEQLASKVDAFLVGSSLMTSPDVGFAARSLVHGVVKICGLRRLEDVDAVADAGATHAGFIYAPNSPRRVDESATTVAAAARDKGLFTVGVFQDQPPACVARIAHDCALDAVQLHGGEIRLEDLRAELPDRSEIWAVATVGIHAGPARPGADRTIFDTEASGRSGGTGLTFDWSKVAGRADLPSAFLAGGIGPANARAAQRIGAFGIDVGSAVEAQPGRKDPAKLATLFAQLRPPCRGSVPCA